MLVVGLVAGLVVARLAFTDNERPEARTAVGGEPISPETEPISPETLSATAVGNIPASGEAAPDPLSAVEGFLAAEAAGDFARSWSLLSGDDRARFMSAAGWEAAHEQIPPVTGFQAGEAGADGSVAVLLQLKAGLDGVLGLVPARAESTWRTTAEDGGWRVAFSRSELRPLYLDDGGATDAAVSWARARQGCDTRPAEQHGSLVGVPGLASQLCDTAGEPTSTELSRLPSADATRLISAFGAGVVDWARIVHLDGPVAMRAVLAPVGQRWLVVGVLPATPPTT